MTLEQYYEVVEIMKDRMWKFPMYSEEYKRAQQSLAFACERIREIQKVQLFSPAPVGSIEEDIQHDAELDLANLS